MSPAFDPEILAFRCVNGGKADGDGSAPEAPLPPNVRVVRVPCAGQVEALYLLKALEQGADGVFVTGCPDEECGSIKGNRIAAARIRRIKDLLVAVGFDPNRAALFTVSPADGGGFADAAREMVERIRKMGPNPLGKSL